MRGRGATITFPARGKLDDLISGNESLDYAVFGSPDTFVT
jgi:hypothetical protein